MGFIRSPPTVASDSVRGEVSVSGGEQGAGRHAVRGWEWPWAMFVELH